MQRVAGGQVGIVLYPATVEKQLEAFWNLIASAYNKAYQFVLTLAADLNPVCIGVNAFAGSSSGAADACAAVTKAVASAAITSLTGLPAGLPMTSTLEAVASGQVGAIATAAMNLGLGQLGLSCDDFTVYLFDEQKQVRRQKN